MSQMSDILEFPRWCTPTNPPIHNASQRLQAFITSTFSFATFRHSLESFEGLRVMNGAALNDESERAEPVREGTGLKNLLEKSYIG
jgi:hypothetical protein